jgi:hypothetical protein
MISSRKGRRIWRRVRAGAEVVIHPPTDQKLRAFCVGDTQVPARGYLSTNHQIVRQSDMLVERRRPGGRSEVSEAWATIRYAGLRNVTVV